MSLLVITSIICGNYWIKITQTIAMYEILLPWRIDVFFICCAFQRGLTCCFSRDMECSTSSSFGSYSGYFGMGRNSEISNSGQENGMVNELGRTAPMRLPLGGGQFPYVPYNLNVLNDTKFQPQAVINPQENAVDYHVNGNFEVPRHAYETTHQSSWASTSGPYAVSILDEPLYPQVDHFCGKFCDGE